MILYRCSSRRPRAGAIPPSCWAYSSIALEYFIDKCDEKMMECGDKIFIIDIPQPAPELIGKYFSIRRHRAPEGASLPFGDDQDGWWSFNEEYSGAFKVIDELELKSLTLTEIDELDDRYRR